VVASLEDLELPDGGDADAVRRLRLAYGGHGVAQRALHDPHGGPALLDALPAVREGTEEGHDALRRVRCRLRLQDAVLVGCGLRADRAHRSLALEQVASGDHTADDSYQEREEDEQKLPASCGG